MVVMFSSSVPWSTLNWAFWEPDLAPQGLIPYAGFTATIRGWPSSRTSLIPPFSIYSNLFVLTPITPANRCNPILFHREGIPLAVFLDISLAVNNFRVYIMYLMSRTTFIVPRRCNLTLVRYGEKRKMERIIEGIFCII